MIKSQAYDAVKDFAPVGNQALNQVLSRDAVKKQLENIGAEAALSSPEEFGKLIAEEVVRWREVAKAAGLEPQ
jgi:tripartite-type tricarboxylate transporter receptor subunit TctC